MSFTIEAYNADDHCWRELPEMPPLDIGPMIELARTLSPGRTLRVIDWPMGATHAILCDGRPVAAMKDPLT